MENIKIKIHKVILVAGYSFPRGKEKVQELILQKKYNWEKIKSHATNFIFINSSNDPWDCNEKQGFYMFKKLGGTLIIREGEGHMGSDSFNQPYKNFPFLEKLLEL